MPDTRTNEEVSAALPGFDAPPESVKLSYGVRLTARNNRAIEDGLHPFGRVLADNGQTCGDCWFAVAENGGRKAYWKCELSRKSHSAVTDLRLRWPACVAFSTACPEGYETTVPKWVTRAGAR